jgi:hypothetical protein
MAGIQSSMNKAAMRLPEESLSSFLEISNYISIEIAYSFLSNQQLVDDPQLVDDQHR